MFRTALISMFLTSAALADTWTVDDDGKADFDNIQAAVDAASDGDEIVVMPGTYTGAGDEAVIDMHGKAVWLHSSEGQEVTFIDGEGLRRGILCDSGETSKTIIEGLTITGGYAYYGGGMRNYNSSNPALTNCTFTDNTAPYGGGMHNTDSSPTLENCTFTNNTAWIGGGMSNYNSSSPTLTDCTFENNTATSSDGGGMYNNSSSPTLTECTFENNTATYSGGGMLNSSISSPTLTDCTFMGNSANYDGGGMHNDYSSPTLTDCLFENNTADSYGGGMRNYNSSNPTLEGCKFTNNTANYGGGMYSYESSSPTTLTNCTFTGNTANWGGGMSCSVATITGCDFIQNIALEGGGIYSWGSSGDDSPYISNSNFCENVPDAIGGNWNNGGGNEFLNTCGDVEGACCVKEACYEVKFLFCDAIGGEWLGYNETCEKDSCVNPPQYGACCINGEAIPLYDYDCDRILGLFMGEGTNPDNVDCPAICAEDINGDGLINVSDLLAVIAVWGACP